MSGLAVSTLSLPPPGPRSALLPAASSPAGVSRPNGAHATGSPAVDLFISPAVNPLRPISPDGRILPCILPLESFMPPCFPPPSLPGFPPPSPPGFPPPSLPGFPPPLGGGCIPPVPLHAPATIAPMHPQKTQSGILRNEPKPASSQPWCAALPAGFPAALGRRLHPTRAPSRPGNDCPDAPAKNPIRNFTKRTEASLAAAVVRRPPCRVSRRPWAAASSLALD
jgi:hypothetical protein